MGEWGVLLRFYYEDRGELGGGLGKREQSSSTLHLSASGCRLCSYEDSRLRGKE